MTRRRTVAMGIAVVVLGAGAALAATTRAPSSVVTSAGSRDPQVLGLQIASKGNGNAKKDVAVVGATSGLHPGAVTALHLTVTNPNNFEISVSSLWADVADASPACTASNLRVERFTGDLRVAKNASATQALVVRMRNDPPDACKGANFPLTYHGTAVKP